MKSGTFRLPVGRTGPRPGGCTGPGRLETVPKACCPVCLRRHTKRRTCQKHPRRFPGSRVRLVRFSLFAGGAVQVQAAPGSAGCLPVMPACPFKDSCALAYRTAVSVSILSDSMWIFTSFILRSCTRWILRTSRQRVSAVYNWPDEKHGPMRLTSSKVDPCALWIVMACP